MRECRLTFMLNYAQRPTLIVSLVVEGDFNDTKILDPGGLLSSGHQILIVRQGFLAVEIYLSIIASSSVPIEAVPKPWIISPDSKRCGNLSLFRHVSTFFEECPAAATAAFSFAGVRNQRTIRAAALLLAVRHGFHPAIAMHPRRQSLTRSRAART